MASVAITFRQILAGYAVFVMIFGALACLVSFLVCIKIKNNNTFIFLTYLSAVNVFTLYNWNLNAFFAIFYNIDFQNLHIFFCKMGDFIQFSSLQASSWLLVSIPLPKFNRLNYFKLSP